MAWSMTSIFTGQINSFGVLVVMRVILGIAQAATEPAALSMMADAIPKEYQASANSLFFSAPLLGIGFCSLGLMLIEKMGWRMYLNSTGVIGLIIGVLTWLLVKEPAR
jgi:MFS family permease